jgi:hypothetical protein
MSHQIQFNDIKIQEAVNLLLQLLETTLFVNVTVKQLMEGKENKKKKPYFSIGID